MCCICKTYQWTLKKVALIQICLHISCQLERMSPALRLGEVPTSSTHLAFTAALGSSLRTILFKKAVWPLFVLKRHASLCLYLTASASKAK